LEKTLDEKVIHLIHLQDIDFECASLMIERDELPQKISDFEEDLKNAEFIIIMDRKRLENLENDRKTNERKLKEEEEMLKKSESKRREVKTNKEYSAVLKEIDTHKEQNSLLEEHILKVMDEIDALKNDLLIKENEFAKKSAEIHLEIHRIQTRIGEVESMFNAKKIDRDGMASRADPDYFKKYEMMAKKGLLPVIAMVRKGICNGCYLNVPPQFFNEMLRDKDLKICPNCGRLIYLEDIPEKGNDKKADKP